MRERRAAPAAGRKAIAPPLGLFDGGNDILPFSPAFAAGLAIAIFLVDTFTPLDVAIAVLYVAVVLLSLNFATRRQLILIAVGCAALTAISFLLSHGIAAPAGSVARFGVSLVAIGVTTGLALRVQSGIDVLTESERRYRNIFLASGVAILEMDFSAVKWAMDAARLAGDGFSARDAIGLMRLTNANATTVKMFGANDLAGFTAALPSLAPPEMEIAIAGLLAAIAAGDRYFEAETVMTTLDGRRIDILCTAAIPADRPQLDTVLISIMDVTRRHDAEFRLGETRAELAHINRVATLGELTASIAHEVNQPLAAIVTNGQAGLRWLSRPQPEVKEGKISLQRIVADAERASDVVKRLRALSMRGASQMLAIDLNMVVTDALSLLRPELRAQQVAAQFEPAAGLPPISGDAVQLQQVMINLVMNGLQAMAGIDPAQRRLTIGLGTHHRKVALTVSDSGPGLPAGDADQVFDAFFTTKPEGMGMGLSICRSIIEAHGGSISAGPAAQGGAAFTILLPIAEQGR